MKLGLILAALIGSALYCPVTASADEEMSQPTLLSAPSLVETCEAGGAAQSETCAFYLAGVLDHSKQFGDGRFDVCAPVDATSESLRDAFLEEIERTGRFIPNDMAAAPYVVTMFVHRGWTC